MENFEVKGKKGSYTVNFGDQSQDPHCTCWDWLTFHLPCKHFFAIFHHFPDWNWEKLLKHYLTSPYLSADSEAIAEYISGTQKSSQSTALTWKTHCRIIQRATILKFLGRFVTTHLCYQITLRMVARCHKYKIDYIAQCELCAHLTHEFFRLSPRRDNRKCMSLLSASPTLRYCLADLYHAHRT